MTLALKTASKVWMCGSLQTCYSSCEAIEWADIEYMHGIDLEYR